jgi:hypothetical protein
MASAGGPSAAAADLLAPQLPALFEYLQGLGAAQSYVLPIKDADEAALHAQLDAFLCGATAASAADVASPDSGSDDKVQSNRQRLFGDAGADEEEKDLPLEYRKSQMGKACGHVFKKGEAVWRCRLVLARLYCVARDNFREGNPGRTPLDL